MVKICVDAGHFGKYNQSPADNDYYESEAMWALHLMLCDELEKRGIQTVKTRAVLANDMSLTARGGMAKGCDLFLSLHSNAVADSVRDDIDYPVSYVSVNGKADEIGLLLAQCVQNIMGTAQPARIEKKTGSQGADYYGVLRGAAGVQTPGVILEHSFHTNTRMTKWLKSTANLKKLAAKEAEIIAAYFSAKEENGIIRYRRLGDIPNEDGFRDIINELMNKGIIRGDGSDSAGNNDIIDMSHDMVRILVLLYRANLFENI